MFGHDYGEIATILGRTEEACRQLAARARRAVGERRPRFEADRERRRELTERFIEACATGDADGLLELLTEDVVVWSDGGGNVAAARRPVVGRGPASRFLVGVARRLPPGATARIVEVNGQPGFVGYLDDTPFVVIALDVAEVRIQGVRIIVNPEKLGSIARESR